MISQEMGLRLADYVVNEVGFGSDLGAEKYFDIVMQQSGIPCLPAAVLVTTVRAIRMQGEGAVERGLPNLGKHIEIVKNFGAPVIVALNQFPDDTKDDLKRLGDFCKQCGAASAVSETFSKGGPGARDLAETVVATIDANPKPPVRSVYALAEPLTGQNSKGRPASLRRNGRQHRRASPGRRLISSLSGAMASCRSASPRLPSTRFPTIQKLLGLPKDWTLHVNDAHGCPPAPALWS